MKHLTLDRDWVKLLGAVTMAGLILAGCGQADRNASGGITTTTSTTITSTSTTTTVPVTRSIATLSARVEGTASLAGLVRVVDQVDRSATAAALADEPSSTDSAHRALVVTSGSLQRYAVLLFELDDDGLEELATLLGDLVEGIDELTAEVAAGRSDLATFVVTLETRIEAVQRARAARAAEWEASWERAGREWQAEWDAYWEQVAEDCEQAWEDAGSGDQER